MSDDLPNSEVVDQFHNDLLVERLTDGDSTGFSNDLEKGASVDGVGVRSSNVAQVCVIDCPWPNL